MFKIYQKLWHIRQDWQVSTNLPCHRCAGVHQNFSITVPNILSLVNLFSPVTQISDLYISSLCWAGNQVTLKTSGKTRTPTVKEKKHQDWLLVNNSHLSWILFFYIFKGDNNNRSNTDTLHTGNLYLRIFKELI